jgi:hypothetical protein
MAGDSASKTNPEACTCRNCGHRSAPGDRFCSSCGQEVLGDQARSFVHLLKASLAEISSVDSRLLRSLGLLFARPGALSREYRLGRRRRYLSPISLFLIANVVFFLAPSLTDFSITLVDQQRLQPYSPLIAGWIEAVLARGDFTPAELAQAYQFRVVELAKTMVILHVPLIALASLLLTVDKRFYYADHVVMALHFFAFLMWYYTLMPWLILPPLDLLDTLITGIDIPVWRVAVSLQYLYVPFMLRTALDMSWWRVIPTTVLLLIALRGIHVVYRFVQFVVTFLFVSA